MQLLNGGRHITGGHLRTMREVHATTLLGCSLHYHVPLLANARGGNGPVHCSRQQTHNDVAASDVLRQFVSVRGIKSCCCGVWNALDKSCSLRTVSRKHDNFVARVTAKISHAGAADIAAAKHQHSAGGVNGRGGSRSGGGSGCKGLGVLSCGFCRWVGSR